MLTYDTPTLWQTGSRNLTGPKTLPTIWHTYMKLVTKYLGRMEGQTDRGKTLFIGVWKFNFETKLRQEVRRFCFNVLRAFALKMQKLPKLSDVGCFLNCLFAIFDGVFAIIIKPWFTPLFWICRGLWYSLISY